MPQWAPYAALDRPQLLSPVVVLVDVHSQHSILPPAAAAARTPFSRRRAPAREPLVSPAPSLAL